MATFFKSLKSLGNLTFGSNKYEGQNNYESSMGKFYDLKQVKDIDGKDRDFNEFYGKVTMFSIHFDILSLELNNDGIIVCNIQNYQCSL